MKKYNVIYADPPWSYGKSKPRKKAHRGGNPTTHYPVMTPDEIKEIGVSKMSKENSCIFLWVTNPKIQIGFDVLAAWGFKYQTIITWEKITKAGEINRGGLGFYFRGATEHILFGTKGRVHIPTGKRLPNIFRAPKSAHSKKPSRAYEIIESVTEGERIELFAREKRQGWDVWGNEVESDIDVRLTKALIS